MPFRILGSRFGGFLFRAWGFRLNYERKIWEYNPWSLEAVPKPPKVGKIMAQNLYKAIILHTFGVQVNPKRP